MITEIWWIGIEVGSLMVCIKRVHAKQPLKLAQ